jgi:hypothetical protein
MPVQHLLSFRRYAIPTVVVAVLYCIGLTLSQRAAAESEKLNGSWVLDEEQSESYIGATKILKAQLLKLQKRHVKQSFDNSHKGGQGGNKYYEQQRASSELRAADTVDVDWSLPGDLDVVMKAKTIKIYQSRMCAVLYDKRFKRLFAINPAGNSYSAKGTEFAHDGLGRTFGYFEREVLVIDTDIKGGDRLVEKFSLNDSGDELKILTRYRRTDLDRTLEYTRIYHRGELPQASVE